MCNFPYEVPAYFLNYYCRPKSFYYKKYLNSKAVFMRRSRIPLLFVNLSVTIYERRITFPKRIISVSDS